MPDRWKGRPLPAYNRYAAGIRRRLCVWAFSRIIKNILGSLLDNGLATYVINPLHTNLYRKSLSLRKTKTDRVNARTIATMLMSDLDLKSYTDTTYHNGELKSLTKYRFDRVKLRSMLKESVSRLVTLLFPELETLVSFVHRAFVYALLYEFPGAKQIADTHLTNTKALTRKASSSNLSEEKVTGIRETARCSVGATIGSKSLELRNTIELIHSLDDEITEIEKEIQVILAQLQSPITTIPGMGFHIGAMILAEIGNFSCFNSPDKILDYAGLSHLYTNPGI